jgi:hypothetical protein
MTMKRPIIGLTAVLVFAICGWMRIGDQVVAQVEGTPVRLVAESGAIDPGMTGNDTFTHAALRKGNLRLIVRTWFYDGNSLAKPYLTVDGSGRAVLHVGVQQHFKLFSTKCEFLRQFEVEIPEAQWKRLNALDIYSHDTKEWVTKDIRLADAAYLRQLLADSQQHAAMRSLSGERSSC